MKQILLILVILLAATNGLTAEEMKVVKTGDPEEGFVYAKEVCANCHSISDGSSPELDATSLMEIANVPGMSAAALLVWMNSLHEKMPNIELEHDEMMDVVAYILSLKSRADESEAEVTKSDGVQSKIDNPEAIAIMGDPQAGLAYAKGACSGCHGVSGEKSPNSEATAFSEVASVQGMSAKSLLVWMKVLHPTMSSITPEREDLMNVIAYILSQKDNGRSKNP
jgi:mono/diheme cytochrome c family protein